MYSVLVSETALESKTNFPFSMKINELPLTISKVRPPQNYDPSAGYGFAELLTVSSTCGSACVTTSPCEFATMFWIVKSLISDEVQGSEIVISKVIVA